jgi:hypothetical protein
LSRSESPNRVVAVSVKSQWQVGTNALFTPHIAMMKGTLLNAVLMVAA